MKRQFFCIPFVSKFVGKFAGKFSKFFGLKPKKMLGIDIGTTSIRVVELSGRGPNNRRLENYGEIGNIIFEERPFRVFEKDTLLLSDADVAEALNMIRQEAGMETKEAIFSLPDFCTFSTSFELPTMSQEELDEAIKYEVRSYIPLPLSEITLDWAITQGEVGKTSIKILVVAIVNDIINQYQSIAQYSNLNLKVLEPEVFALARALIKKEDENKVLGLVDLGARSCTCNIHENKILKMSHSFNVAGNELTQVLAKSLNIEYNKAEVIKRKYGIAALPDTASEAAKSVKGILQPLLDTILEEIKKTLRDFYRSEGKEAQKIILAGGLALMPGLKEYFAAELKKEVVTANPFAGISYPPLLEKILKERSPAYSIAAGLALKGLE